MVPLTARGSSSATSYNLGTDLRHACEVYEVAKKHGGRQLPRLSHARGLKLGEVQPMLVEDDESMSESTSHDLDNILHTSRHCKRSDFLNLLL